MKLLEVRIDDSTTEFCELIISNVLLCIYKQTR